MLVVDLGFGPTPFTAHRSEALEDIDRSNAPGNIGEGGRMACTVRAEFEEFSVFKFLELRIRCEQQIVSFNQFLRGVP